MHRKDTSSITELKVGARGKTASQIKQTHRGKLSVKSEKYNE